MSKKKKASDIFNESTPFLGKKGNFIETFPKISRLEIEVIEYKDFWKKDDGYYPLLQGFNEQNLQQYVDCSEQNCKGGGFSIANIIYSMMQDNISLIEGSANCIGKIGSQSCRHTFDYKISITYK